MILRRVVVRDLTRGREELACGHVFGVERLRCGTADDPWPKSRRCLVCEAVRESKVRVRLRVIEGGRS